MHNNPEGNQLLRFWDKFEDLVASFIGKIRKSLDLLTTPLIDPPHENRHYIRLDLLACSSKKLVGALWGTSTKKLPHLSNELFNVSKGIDQHFDNASIATAARTNEKYRNCRQTSFPSVVLNIGTSAQLSVIIDGSCENNISNAISSYPALHVVPYFRNSCLVVAAALTGKNYFI